MTVVMLYMFDDGRRFLKFIDRTSQFFFPVYIIKKQILTDKNNQTFTLSLPLYYLFFIL